MSYAEQTTIRGVYTDAEYGLGVRRADRVAAGTLAANSRRNDLHAISCWERYSARPSGWPADAAWGGRPLAYITSAHCTDWVRAMRRSASLSTIRSVWGHLRIILRWAVQIGAIDQLPEPAWPADREISEREIYTDEQVAAVHHALAADADLQTAFVVACNVGPRAVDLFQLRWENCSLDWDRPVVQFRARKTGKEQRVPLADVTVGRLKWWARQCGQVAKYGLIWPRLTDGNAPDPERSRAARARNARMKRRLAALNIQYEKPWQAARRTCNERLERHVPGSGQFVLGHAATLNSRSYREPSEWIYRAVTTLPQPECFRS